MFGIKISKFGTKDGEASFLSFFLSIYLKKGDKTPNRHCMYTKYFIKNYIILKFDNDLTITNINIKDMLIIGNF